MFAPNFQYVFAVNIYNPDFLVSIGTGLTKNMNLVKLNKRNLK